MHNVYSPINDILDKEFYTLEELLEEDDLLQEVKSKNERLLAFLQTEETVQKLVEYVVTSADADATDHRVYKYPYMACELFCCEIQKILDILVEHQDGKFLTMLFSLLEHEAPLDHYLAGYFEKVLEMLFRRMTMAVMMYLNNGGIPLLQKFLNHIENYSIMQIVQRVMLPHIPFSMDDVEIMSPEEKRLYQCDWSFQKETCYLLCSRMLAGGSYDIPSHISDLLITVLQLSPHDSLFLTHLCEPQCLDDLLKFSFQEYTERTCVTDIPSVESSLSLASISVLESLISRLCETMNPFESGDDADKDMFMDDARKTMMLISECVDKVSSALIEHVPKFAAQLTAYCETDVCGTFQSQTQCTYRRLGQRGLQLVKLVEAIVRLANDHIDTALCTSGALKACVDLMFQYKLNSLLHLSVQRIILILIEGGATERYVCFDELIIVMYCSVICFAVPFDLLVISLLDWFFLVP
jgi:serine/threonine-protein phosphatase 6 regulatory subunit 3